MYILAGLVTSIGLEPIVVRYANWIDGHFIVIAYKTMTLFFLAFPIPTVYMKKKYYR